MPRSHFRRRPRPVWWPENQPWPPERPVRHFPFFRGVGCAIALVTVIGWLLVFAAFFAVAHALGLFGTGIASMPWPVPAMVALVLGFALPIAFLGWTARRAFLPLDSLLEASDRIAAGDYTARVDERGPRQLRSLARAFNNMATRLDAVQSDRRNLLADVTHELRTPLTVIQGNLEGMLDGVYKPDEAGLRAILEETTLLSRLIEDLRTLALAESGALQLKRESTDIGALIFDVQAAFQPQARAQQVNLLADVPGGLPALDLDPARIRQVLTNLVANALRYTPAGGDVKITAVQRETGLVIDVRDTGQGISTVDLPHVFDRFYKSADSSGTGLGLAIARHLVQAHGGTLTASSDLGQGTTMHVSLPAQA
jgi:two-component system sensor histidine kinase BaeS